MYYSDFLARFLGIFEAILTPIEWNVDNYDLYLSPGTAPLDYLTWLAKWFKVTFDASWTESQRRTFLAEAHQIYAGRGTKRVMSRILEIYLGIVPQIVEPEDQPHLFSVVLRIPSDQQVDRAAIERLIEANKPAHTNYTLEIFQEKKRRARA
jgi:phage tail-like protein